MRVARNASAAAVVSAIVAVVVPVVEAVSVAVLSVVEDAVEVEVEVGSAPVVVEHPAKTSPAAMSAAVRAGVCQRRGRGAVVVGMGSCQPCREIKTLA